MYVATHLQKYIHIDSLDCIRSSLLGLLVLCTLGFVHTKFLCVSRSSLLSVGVVFYPLRAPSFFCFCSSLQVLNAKNHDACIRSEGMNAPRVTDYTRRSIAYIPYL